MNWPPTTMATQHPDNASAPWWNSGSAFVSTHDEIEELITLFMEHSIDEYMWDWEGKYVDEAVGEKIFSKAHELFQKKPLGKELHLTFRIPPYEEGKLYKSARAFSNILSLSDLAQDIGMHVPPVREMFLPLTTSAEQLLNIRETFLQIADYHRAIFHKGERKHDALLSQVQVTPLIEDTDSYFNIDRILRPYWETLLRDNVDCKERGQRIFLARSDPALNAGLVPAVIATKVALHTAISLGQELGFAVYPIIGTGSLPFRGSVNPLYLDTFLEQYAGVSTYCIQSAFRYDFVREDMEEALKVIKREAPRKTVQEVTPEDREKLIQIADICIQEWKGTIEALAPLINRISAYIPSRRERRQHIGLFGYNRGVGKVSLPRAIKFTAALYSIGIPPELISTGRALRAVEEKGLLAVLDRYYPALRADLEHPGKYLNRENIALAAKDDPVFQAISHDIDGIDAYLGSPLGPWKPHHTIHRNLTSTLYYRFQEEEPDAAAVQRDIVEAAVIRRSLG